MRLHCGLIVQTAWQVRVEHTLEQLSICSCVLGHKQLVLAPQMAPCAPNTVGPGWAWPFTMLCLARGPAWVVR
jgi:hypothetical protein